MLNCSVTKVWDMLVDFLLRETDLILDGFYGILWDSWLKSWNYWRKVEKLVIPDAGNNRGSTGLDLIYSVAFSSGFCVLASGTLLFTPIGKNKVLHLKYNILGDLEGAIWLEQQFSTTNGPLWFVLQESGRGSLGVVSLLPAAWCALSVLQKPGSVPWQF